MLDLLGHLLQFELDSVDVSVHVVAKVLYFLV